MGRLVNLIFPSRCQRCGEDSSPRQFRRRRLNFAARNLALAHCARWFVFILCVLCAHVQFGRCRRTVEGAASEKAFSIRVKGSRSAVSNHSNNSVCSLSRTLLSLFRHSTSGGATVAATREGGSLATFRFETSAQRARSCWLPAPSQQQQEQEQDLVVNQLENVVIRCA